MKFNAEKINESSMTSASKVESTDVTMLEDIEKDLGATEDLASYGDGVPPPSKKAKRGAIAIGSPLGKAGAAPATPHPGVAADPAEDPQRPLPTLTRWRANTSPS